MNPKLTTVALVDDHELLRNGLAGIIDKFEGYKVIFEAGNGLEFIRQLPAKGNPDIVLLDISMPEMDGYETAEWIKSNLAGCRILVLSMLDHEIAVIRMLHAGARGYILKDCKPAQLKEAFDQIQSFGYYSNDLVTSRMMKQIRDGKVTETGDFKITGREHEFLKYVCTDMTYRDIARKMNASPRTIDNYRDSLFEKFDIKSRVGLALFAIKQGYLTL